jgi:hypothetical protein
MESTQSHKGIAQTNNEKRTTGSITGILTDTDDGEDGEKLSTAHRDRTARNAVREKIMVRIVWWVEESDGNKLSTCQL